MPIFSILVQVKDATAAKLEGLIQNLLEQTFTDWELVLLPSRTNPTDVALCTTAAITQPKVRVVQRDETDIAQWSANDIAETLGNWFGFMGLQDRLHFSTLWQIINKGDNDLALKVIYTDEESRNRDGLVSLRFEKGGINPLRLRFQDYLRDLVVIDRTWFLAAGGFDRMATDYPGHDFYLRTLDALGADAFGHLPQRLFYRHRNHAERRSGKERRDILNGFDMHGIAQHLTRNAVPAVLRRRGGTAEIVHRLQRKPWVTLLVVNDGSPLMEETMRSAYTHFLYRPLNVRAIPAGPDLVERLNQEILGCDTELACVLQGLPINPDWLDDLVAYSIFPNAAAIGGRLINPVQLTEPGLLNYRFEGWDWNSRGRFNELATPHQVSAVSPHVLLLDVRKFAAAGGFATDLPQLYAMDLCLRLNQAGQAVIQVPRAMAQVLPSTPTPEETTTFWGRWSNWSCPFGLHLPA